LQRKCACGKHTTNQHGECTECGKKRMTLQRRALHDTAPQTAPPIVHEVLRSPGRPLDAATRAYMEPRFGTDFSQVRLHDDARAARSAQAVNALAYTVGSDIVFAQGQRAAGVTSGRQLLAHELTHVVQQTARSGPVAPESRSEAEANHNSRRVLAGQVERGGMAAPAARIQRQEKSNPAVSGERSVSEEGKYKFTFKAEVKVPVTPDLSLGPVSFLDDLKLTGSGGVSGEALGAGDASFDDLKLQLALRLAQLELATTKDKALALRKGKLSLGATLNTTGSQTFSFDPLKPKSSVGASFTLKPSLVSPTLLPARLGELTASSSLSATGSVTRDLGSEGSATPSAEVKAGTSIDYKSPSSRQLTLGGVLGKEAQVTAGLETGISGAITPEKTSGKLSGGASVGLSGKDKGTERYIKLQIKGDVGLDRKSGEATATTQSLFIGVSTGFKF
jgi:hypothetical protein